MENKFRFWDGTEFSYKNNASDNFFKDEDGEVILDYHPLPEQVIVHQSTGLKDKNGKLIYEGDILESIEDGYIYEILICDRWTRFAEYDLVHTIGKRGDEGEIIRSNGISQHTSDDMISNPGFYEIIGNVEESLELTNPNNKESDEAIR
jgi:uncharacterized phage protein (TIGR01671 family)